MTTPARPKVSILIPVYNTAKYLDACMKSVREQTLKDIEIIAVNDASPDNAAEVLAKYAALDPRIKVVTHEKNGGILAARISGIKAATGEFIICLDADDTLNKDIARAAYAKARKTGADMVHFQFDVRLGNGKKTPFARKVEKDLRPAKESFLGEKVFEAAFIDRKYRWNICGKMIAHDVFRKAAEALPPGYYIMAEDFCFYTLMSFYSKHYEPLNKKGYNYVLNIGVSAYTVADRQGFERSCSVFTAMNAVRGFLEKNGVFEKYEKAFRLQEGLLLGDLLGRWYHRVLPADREYCFDFMLKNYDPLAITAAMADTFTAPCEMEDAAAGIGNANGFFAPSAPQAAGKCAVIGGAENAADILNRQIAAAAKNNGFTVIPMPEAAPSISSAIRQLVKTLRSNAIDTVIIPENNLSTDLIWILLSLKVANFRTIVIPAGSSRGAYRSTIGRNSGNFLSLRFADAVASYSQSEAEFYRFCGIRSCVIPVSEVIGIKRDAEAKNIVCFGEAGNLAASLMALGAAAKLNARKVFDGELVFISTAIPEESERRLNEWKNSLNMGGKVRFVDLFSAGVDAELAKAAAVIAAGDDETTAKLKFFSSMNIVNGNPATVDMDTLSDSISAALQGENAAVPAVSSESWQSVTDVMSQPQPGATVGAGYIFARYQADAEVSLLYERYAIVPPRDGDTFHSLYAFFDKQLARFFPAGSRKRHILFAGLRCIMRKLFRKG